MAFFAAGDVYRRMIWASGGHRGQKGSTGAEQAAAEAGRGGRSQPGRAVAAGLAFHHLESSVLAARRCRRAGRRSSRAGGRRRRRPDQLAGIEAEAPGRTGPRGKGAGGVSLTLALGPGGRRAGCRGWCGKAVRPCRAAGCCPAARRKGSGKGRPRKGDVEQAVRTEGEVVQTISAAPAALRLAPRGARSGLNARTGLDAGTGRHR